MRAIDLTLLAAVVAAAPAAFAHTDGGLYGTPKTYCEDSQPGDSYNHDYGPPASGYLLALPFDGSVPPCPYAPTWDGHYEFAVGGAWLLACDGPCGPDDKGAGGLLCWKTYADHAEHPRVWVFDHVLHSLGNILGQVAFAVAVDNLDNVPASNPTEPECGDMESDQEVDCVDHCSVPFRPGLDGTYQVYVAGTAGHVWSD